MNIDINKINEVVIYDENGNISDRFGISSLAVVKFKNKNQLLQIHKEKKKNLCPADGRTNHWFTNGFCDYCGTKFQLQ